MTIDEIINRLVELKERYKNYNIEDVKIITENFMIGYIKDIDFLYDVELMGDYGVYVEITGLKELKSR